VLLLLAGPGEPAWSFSQCGRGDGAPRHNPRLYRRFAAWRKKTPGKPASIKNLPNDTAMIAPASPLPGSNGGCSVARQREMRETCCCVLDDATWVLAIRTSGG